MNFDFNMNFDGPGWKPVVLYDNKWNENEKKILHIKLINFWLEKKTQNHKMNEFFITE